MKTNQIILSIITIAISVVFAVASATYKIPRWQDEITRIKIKAHSKERICEAHPDAMDRFVTKTSQGQALGQIDKRLTRIESMLEYIKRRSQ